MPEPTDIVEALLFASDTPLEAARIRDVLDLETVEDARALVQQFRERLETAGRALQVTEVAGGYRLVTRPELSPWLVRLARARIRQRLSRPALETLAIVAYRVQASRPEIDALRGVNSEGVLDNLLERRLLRIAGRKDGPGRPFIYETTREFLIAFGLRDLGDLPRIDGELILPDLDAAGATAGVESGDAAGAASAEDGGDTGMTGAVPETTPDGNDDDKTEAQQDPGAGRADVTPGG
jgi:segregation and condensation protein B